MEKQDSGNSFSLTDAEYIRMLWLTRMNGVGNLIWFSMPFCVIHQSET